jgi:hypothetical protein
MKHCLATYEITSSGSVLSEQRSTGPGWSDFPARYNAAEIDEASYTPVQATARFTLAGRPLLWFTPDKRDAVVDVRFSSTLLAVDVPMLRAGERRFIGALTPEGRALPPRDFLEFLLRAGVARTYWHLGSELCLEQEAAAGGSYRARLSGAHVYFTSRKHRVPLAFVVELGAGGEIVLEGG